MKTTKILRKVIVAAIGFPLLIVGIILIPLPGPGLVVCFIALLILSMEFEWTRKYLDKIKVEFRKIMDKSKERQEKINKKYK